MGQEFDRLLAQPFAAIEWRAENLRRGLAQRGQEVPQFYGIELDWRRRAEDDASGIARGLLQKHEKIVRFCPRLAAAFLSCGARLVRLVENDHAE